MKQYQLPKEFAEKWVSALRSGEHEQGQGSLATHDFKYCCIGVAGLLYDIPAERMMNFGWLYEVDHDTSLIPREIKSGIGLSEKVATLNDEEELSFLEIADWIEENVEFV